MIRIFSGKSTFNDDISNWDTSSVTTMSQMFENATSFNQDIRGWDTSSMTTDANFNFMFNGATAIQAPPLSAPDTPNKSTRWFNSYP